MGGRRVPDVPLDRVFNSPTTPVHAFLAALGNLSYKERKSIVTLCRAQKVPSRQEAKILAYQAFGNHDGVDDLQDTHFRRLCALVRKYIESPLWSGFLLDLEKEPPLQLLLDEYDNTIKLPQRLYRFSVISVPYALSPS